MKRSDVVDNSNIKGGEVIVGLASHGQAEYETEYNGGMGSNGLTSARHDVFCKEYMAKYPEAFDPAVPAELVFSGSKHLTDAVDGSPLDAGKLVLSPTRTYAPVIKKMLESYRSQIHGMELNRKKLIIPLVIGGIGTSLAIVAMSMGWYDRMLNVIAIFIFFGILYYGFIGKDAIEIKEKGVLQFIP